MSVLGRSFARTWKTLRQHERCDFLETKYNSSIYGFLSQKIQVQLACDDCVLEDLLILTLAELDCAKWKCLILSWSDVLHLIETSCGAVGTRKIGSLALWQYPTYHFFPQPPEKERFAWYVHQRSLQIQKHILKSSGFGVVFHRWWRFCGTSRLCSWGSRWRPLYKRWWDHGNGTCEDLWNCWKILGEKDWRISIDIVSTVLDWWLMLVRWGEMKRGEWTRRNVIILCTAYGMQPSCWRL